MLTGFVSIKVVAVIIGPSGVALLGQINNFAAIALTLASGGINNGVTKYLAEFKESSFKLCCSYIANGARITFFCSIFVGLLILLFARYLSIILLHDPSFYYVFVIFAITIILYGLNMLLIAIVNGFQNFKKYVSINIADSLLGLIFSLTLVYFWGIKGAVISAVTYQSVVFFITLWLLRKEFWLKLSFFTQRFDGEIVRKYLQYSSMALVTAICVPFTQMILRSYVISTISSAQAGLWEGMNRLSNMYLLVITTSFSVYYLPKLSSISNRSLLSKEIKNAYYFLIPVIFVGFSLVYLFRSFIILVVFSADFARMQDLFAWQLAGDFFKIISWISACLMIAKSLTKLYIITEMIFSSLFLLLGYLFVNRYGVEGLTKAYFVNYFIYFLCMTGIYKYLIKKIL